jgi:hypothetical protein
VVLIEAGVHYAVYAVVVGWTGTPAALVVTGLVLCVAEAVVGAVIADPEGVALTCPGCVAC